LQTLFWSCLYCIFAFQREEEKKHPPPKKKEVEEWISRGRPTASTNPRLQASRTVMCYKEQFKGLSLDIMCILGIGCILVGKKAGATWSLLPCIWSILLELGSSGFQGPFALCHLGLSLCNEIKSSTSPFTMYYHFLTQTLQPNCFLLPLGILAINLIFLCW
jgi:hypothetical protein